MKPWQKMAIVFGIIAMATLVVGVELGIRQDRQAPDRAAIQKRYAKWHAALREKRFDDAFTFMTPEYRASHTAAELGDEFRVFWMDDLYVLSPDCSLKINGSRARLYPRACGWFELRNGPEYEWVKQKNEWFLTGKYKLFFD